MKGTDTQAFVIIVPPLEHVGHYPFNLLEVIARLLHDGHYPLCLRDMVGSSELRSFQDGFLDRLGTFRIQMVGGV